jgi:hypothetical protein
MNTARVIEPAVRPETTELLDQRMRSTFKRQRQLSIAVYALALVVSAIGLAAILNETARARSELAAVQALKSDAETKLTESRKLIRERTAELQTLQAQTHSLGEQVGQLEKLRAGLLDFLGKISASSNLLFLDADVDWKRTQATILGMRPGSRQSALLSAILVSWKQVPFSLSGNSLETGINSPHFALLILDSVGVKNLPRQDVWREGDPRLSDLVLRRFSTKTTSPEPGDLMITWVSGTSGRLVTFYLGEGACLGNDGSRAGFRIFQCEAYVRSRGWTNPIEYHHVDYP